MALPSMDDDDYEYADASYAARRMTPPTTPTQAERDYAAAMVNAPGWDWEAAMIRDGRRDVYVLAIMRHLRTNPLPEEVKC